MLDDPQKTRSNATTTSIALFLIALGSAIFALERVTHIGDGWLQLQMFPVVLALIGVALLFSRISRALTMLLICLIAAGIIGYVLFGRTLGIPGAPDFLLQSYVEPVNGATSADVTLDVGAQTLVVSPLADPKTLLSTQVDFGSTLDQQSNGTAQRVVSVHNSKDGFSALTDLFQSAPKAWEVDLNPTVPIALHVISNTTPMQLNLGSAHLVGLSIDGNTGALEATLPAAGDVYTATISVNSADTTLTLPEGAVVNLTLSSSAGATVINLAADAAVEVTVSGAGTVNIPDTWHTLNQSGLTGNGTWQTANFAGTTRHSVIIFQTGTGSLTVQ